MYMDNNDDRILSITKNCDDKHLLSFANKIPISIVFSKIRKFLTVTEFPENVDRIVINDCPGLFALVKNT